MSLDSLIFRGYDWGRGLPLASDFVDAKTLGCTYGVTFSDNTSGNAIIIQTNLDETASTITAGTNRAQGVMIAAPSGDFVWGVRVHAIWHNSSDALVPLDGTGAGTSPSVLTYCGVFVDGTDLANSAWYGMCKYCESIMNSSIYKMSKTSGSNIFDTYVSYDNYADSNGWEGSPTLDWFIQRDSTTLRLYLGIPGQAPNLVSVETVGTGAGYVGVRYQSLIGETDFFDLAILKTGFLTDVPPYA